MAAFWIDAVSGANTYWTAMLIDALTIFFLLAGSWLLWINIRHLPGEVILTRSDHDDRLGSATPQRARARTSSAGKAKYPVAHVAANPEKSDRAIAKEIGVSHPTVGKARKELTGNGLPVDTRIGLDGKVRRLPQRENPRPKPGENRSSAEGPQYHAHSSHQL